MGGVGLLLGRGRNVWTSYRHENGRLFRWYIDRPNVVIERSSHWRWFFGLVRADSNLKQWALGRTRVTKFGDRIPF